MKEATPVASPAATDQTRTGPLVAQLVEGVQHDIGDVVDALRAALGKVRALEAHAKGINGLAGTLRAEAQKIDHAISALTEESASVAKKLLGTGREPVAERVDEAHLERVKAAREAVSA